VTVLWNVVGMGIFLPFLRALVDDLIGGASAMKLAYSTAVTQDFFFGSSFLLSSLHYSFGF
jgi:hypothetical protein